LRGGTTVITFDCDADVEDSRVTEDEVLDQRRVSLDKSPLVDIPVPVDVNPEDITLILNVNDPVLGGVRVPEKLRTPGKVVVSSVAFMLEDVRLESPDVDVVFDHGGVTVDETSLDKVPVPESTMLETVRVELRKDVTQVLEMIEDIPIDSGIVAVVFARDAELDADPEDEVFVNGGPPEISGVAVVLGERVTVLSLITDNVRVIIGPVDAASDEPLLASVEDPCVVLER
jgi:hypothetical protein